MNEACTYQYDQINRLRVMIQGRAMNTIDDLCILRSVYINSLYDLRRMINISDMSYQVTFDIDPYTSHPKFYHIIHEVIPILLKDNYYNESAAKYTWTVPWYTTFKGDMKELIEAKNTSREYWFL